MPTWFRNISRSGGAGCAFLSSSDFFFLFFIFPNLCLQLFICFESLFIYVFFQSQFVLRLAGSLCCEKSMRCDGISQCNFKWCVWALRMHLSYSKKSSWMQFRSGLSVCCLLKHQVSRGVLEDLFFKAGTERGIHWNLSLSCIDQHGRECKYFCLFDYFK